MASSAGRSRGARRPRGGVEAADLVERRPESVQQQRQAQAQHRVGLVQPRAQLLAGDQTKLDGATVAIVAERGRPSTIAISPGPRRHSTNRLPYRTIETSTSPLSR